LRKKLFLPVAGPSPRLRVHRHLLRHHAPPSSSSGWLPGPASLRKTTGALYEIASVRSTNPYTTVDAIPPRR
jgi:hypothetical protein